MVKLPEIKMNLPEIKMNLPEIKVNLPKIEKVNISRVVLISGLLTFLYLIEFCLGIRSVYHTFSLWNSSPYASKNAQVVSWTLCVACLLVCVTSSFTANLISAMWEQKQLKEKGQEKSAIRFAFHIIVGGMIWRYVCLWFSDKKELQKKEAMLLTMAKFLFTQFYTIPMIIVSASLLENFQEMIYDLSAVACISVTLLLTCIMFSWCKSEVDDLKKWSFETVDLVPLIFCQSSDDPQKSNNASKSEEKESGNSVAEISNENDNALETTFLRIIVLLQTLSFTFGRLLALGVLVRLAGIYAVSIMFLQLLISVVYLKFQVPFLVSDSLPKWRQLCRLAFMSYILIFEWHLNRDPKTGYDFTSNIKHSMLYYLIATLESIFYFVTWAITESYMSSNYLDYLGSPKRKFVRNLIVVGSMSLVFSLTIYILLMFWQSRRLSKLLHSLQRSYLSSKLKMVNSGSRNWMKRKSEGTSDRPRVDISNPIAINTTADISSTNEEGKELEKHSSYRDLREPIDDEIELYVRNGKNANGFKTSLEKINNNTERSPVTKKERHSIKRIENSNMEGKSDVEVKTDEFDKSDSEISFSLPESQASSPAVINVSKNKNGFDDKSVKSDKSAEKSPSPSLKSVKNSNTVDASTNVSTSTVKQKMTAISESMSGGWNKFSSLSRKFTGAMQEQIQRSKEKIQNFRTSSGNDNTEQQQSSEKVTDSNATEATSSVNSNCIQTVSKTVEDLDSSEGYFMGDSRCTDGKNYQPNQDIDNDSADTEFEEEESEPVKSASVVNLYEEASDPEPIHCEGSEPCPCFVCRTTGDGQILRRRRSSSVPLPERKTRPNLSSKIFPEESSITRFASTSNIVQMDARGELRDGKTKDIDTSHVPKLYVKGSFQNLSLMSLDNRIEHYV